jgi:uncharacterized protein (DUF302 family)
MNIGKLSIVIAVAMLVTTSPFGSANADEHDGITKIKSVYPLPETVAHIKEQVANLGIRSFAEIDQSELAAQAETELRPSTLLVFGNPELGARFIEANPLAGLDWPIRLLVTQDDSGTVWIAWTDFDWIARRHRITNRAVYFKIANDVITTVTGGVVVP